MQKFVPAQYYVRIKQQEFDAFFPEGVAGTVCAPYPHAYSSDAFTCLVSASLTPRHSWTRSG